MSPLLLPLLLTACDGGQGAVPQDASPAPPAAPASTHRWADAQPGAGSLQAQLSHHCATARDLGLHPYAELNAIWCAPCKALRKAMDDPAMQQAFEGTYVVGVDVDLFAKELEPLGLVTYGVPAIFALGPDCKATGAMITGGDWGADIPAEMAPPLTAFFAAQRQGKAAPVPSGE